MKEAYETNWMSTVCAIVNEVEQKMEVFIYTKCDIWDRDPVVLEKTFEIYQM